jgi:dolichol-phosphate mannosyltransferase
MLSVVAPVFNEAETVAELVSRLTAALPPLGPYEIVIVDDGSTDGTWEQLATIAAGHPHVRAFRLSRNFGHQAALSAGLDHARGDAVVLMDGDLQDPPEVIPDLVARWQEGYDVVYAVRRQRAGETRFKLVTASLFYRLLSRMASTQTPENAGDFRLLSRRAVDSLARMPERARYLRGMTSWIGFRQTGVAYDRESRHAGETKYPLSKLLRLALDGITSFSTWPIRAVTFLGFALVAFCVGVFGWSLYVRFFTDRHAAGWTSVIGVVLLLGGVQLLSLGVLGQYVGRIFEEAKQRPLYFVADVVETDPLELAASSSASRWASTTF